MYSINNKFCNVFDVLKYTIEAMVDCHTNDEDIKSFVIKSLNYGHNYGIVKESQDQIDRCNSISTCDDQIDDYDEDFYEGFLSSKKNDYYDDYDDDVAAYEGFNSQRRHYYWEDEEDLN